MPTLKEFTFPSSNGKTSIYVRSFIPQGAPRGIVQIAHGIAEHSARYDGFAAFLAEHGFVVYTNDHLGHGRSLNDESELGFFADNGGWEMAVEDMRKLHDIAAEEFPGIPHFLFGHSMGSFLARTYIIYFRSGLDGVILSGTGQQAKALVLGGKLLSSIEIKKNGGKFKSEMLNNIAFGKYNDGFDTPRTISDWISRDEAEVDKYIEDPLCGYIPSASLFHDMMCGIDFITKTRNVQRMNKSLPVYFMSGDADPVGENGKGVLRAYKSFLAAGMKDVAVKLYHDGRHEMLNELNRDEVYRDILNWLEGEMDK
ncbi:MAG: alpha/beta hydrolase [Ruminococcaceae bacterium]|nr:alpha/beta hydrolase [Oscillospiraceae bacterium]